MIRSFWHKGLQRLFAAGERRGIRPNLVEKVENILAVLSRARVPEDMRLPGFNVHLLKGDLRGYWSVTVRANWRIIFRFQDGDVWDIDLIDYH